MSLHPSYLPADPSPASGSWQARRRLVAILWAQLASRLRAPSPMRAEPVRGLRDGSVELEVVLAVVADLHLEVDATGTYRVSFVLEGHLPATQLSRDGVTVVALEALRISDLAVSRDVVERLTVWEADEAALTGRLHFEREVVDTYRGRGPLRTLALADERGEEIVLQRG